MTIRRYNRSPILLFGQKYGTSYAIQVIRDNIKNGSIRFSDYVTAENERLDILAGKFYGDSKLYWVLAACSEIGWVAQIPPGTILKIPLLNDIEKLIA